MASPRRGARAVLAVRTTIPQNRRAGQTADCREAQGDRDRASGRTSPSSPGLQGQHDQLCSTQAILLLKNPVLCQKLHQVLFRKLDGQIFCKSFLCLEPVAGPQLEVLPLSLGSPEKSPLLRCWSSLGIWMKGECWGAGGQGRLVPSCG